MKGEIIRPAGTGKRLSPLKRGFLILLGIAAVLCCQAGFVQADIQLIGNLTHRYQVNQGGEYTGELVIHNSGDKMQSVRIYQRDYHFNAVGQSTFADPGTLARSNAPWIRLNTETVRVPPGKQQTVAYHLKVPAQTGLDGTYWSIIMVEPVPGAEVQGMRGEGPDNLGIRQNYSYGVQIVSNFAGSGEKRLVFNRPELRLNGESGCLFKVELKNTGTCWLIPAVWLELYNQAGELIDRFNGEKLRLFPGTSVCQQIELGSLQPGSYQALLIADNGDEAVFGIKYTLQVE